jgi:hypothetical protein
MPASFYSHRAGAALVHVSESHSLLFFFSLSDILLSLPSCFDFWLRSFVLAMDFHSLDNGTFRKKNQSLLPSDYTYCRLMCFPQAKEKSPQLPAIKHQFLCVSKSQVSLSRVRDMQIPIPFCRLLFRRRLIT